MTKNKEVEVFVAGLVLDPATNAPIVILKETSSDICLPIWIGLPEATSIASALKKMKASRPMTHDLMRSFIEEFGGKVAKIIIRDLQENTFFATIELVFGEVVKQIDARPSDAIALAVRVGCPIMVNREVLDRAQVELVTDNQGPAVQFDVPEEDPEQQSNFANIEKEKWEEILAEMEPDDFKYKM